MSKPQQSLFESDNAFKKREREYYAEIARERRHSSLDSWKSRSDDGGKDTLEEIRAEVASARADAEDARKSADEQASERLNDELDREIEEWQEKQDREEFLRSQVLSDKEITESGQLFLKECDEERALTEYRAKKRRLQEDRERIVRKKNVRLASSVSEGMVGVVGQRYSNSSKESESGAYSGVIIAIVAIVIANIAAVPVALVSEAVTLFTNNVVADQVFAIANLIAGLIWVFFNTGQGTLSGKLIDIALGSVMFTITLCLLSSLSFASAYGTVLLPVFLVRVLVLRKPND